MKIPKSLQNLPQKMMLTGGGMCANEFLLVNVLEVHEAIFPSPEHKTVLQAKVEERHYSGIEIFEPYLECYKLYPINDKAKQAPLDTYLAQSDGTATGHYTKHIIK